MKNLESLVRMLEEKPVAVFGLARSGLSTVRALKTAGSEVIAWDDNPRARDRAVQLGARVEPLTQKVLSECAFLVLAPGVPLHYPEPHPVVQAARMSRTEILCDIELFHRMRHGRKTVGVTGTNGKSTTTALIHHILKSSGIDVVMGGNIGLPVFDLPMPKVGGVFVFELSSYQLDLCPTFRPDIGVLLNITPDHLDRHGTMDLYVAAKEKIFEGPGTGIVGVDDDYGRKILKRQQGKGYRKIIPLAIADNVSREKLQSATLRGDHNYQNALAALLVCREMGLSDEKIFSAVATFPGLPHRQFPVRIIDGVTYINDSKATNAESASKALVSYSNIYWIAGGRPKEGGLTGLEPLARRVKKSYLIGEASYDFARWMQVNGIPFEECGDMKTAVANAHTQAQEDHEKSGQENVVLLSPACASFDQFSSYEERGDVFTQLVNNLPGAGP